MRIVSGCLPPSPTDFLPILANTELAELHRQAAALSPAYRSLMDPKQLLHQLMTEPTTAHEGRLNDLDTSLFLQHASCSMNYLN